MISTVQRTVEVPQIEYVDNHVHIPVHKHRHVPVVHTVEKIVDVPVVKQVDVPHVTTIEKIVEVPHVQVVEKIEEVPMQGQVLPGQERHTSIPLPAVRQMGQAEEVTVNEIGPPLEAVHGGQVMREAPMPQPQIVQQAPVTYAAPVTTVQAAPASVSYAAPATTMVAEPVYVQGGSASVAAAQPVTYAAPPVTYAAPATTYGSVSYAAPATTYAQGGLFAQIDTNHDGGISRQEFA